MPSRYAGSYLVTMQSITWLAWSRQSMSNNSIELIAKVSRMLPGLVPRKPRHHCLLLVSSLAAMGPSSPQRPRLESDLPAPVSHYGRSKLAGEQAARRWANEVPITVLRPPVVFGECDAATCEIFRPIARCGVHVVPSWRTHRVSLIHADDLLQAMVLAVQRGKRIIRDPANGPPRRKAATLPRPNGI